MPEQRRDPTTGRWTLLAGARGDRPFATLKVPPLRTPPAQCPFCPGHESHTLPELARVEGPEGWRVRAFPNLFPALRVEEGTGVSSHGPWDAAEGCGAHEVIVETPLHDVPPWHTEGQLALALGVARDRLADLRGDRRLRYLGWFRNHGALAGASQSHSHAQILATAQVPATVVEMAERLAAHQARAQHDLIGDLLRHSRDEGQRMLWEDAEVAAFCPFAPRFPFEVWLVPKAFQPHLADASDATLASLGAAMSWVMRRLDHCLDHPAMSTLLYAAPEGPPHGFRWHIRVAPRLTALGGWEVGQDAAILSVSPEESAATLRAV